MQLSLKMDITIKHSELHLYEPRFYVLADRSQDRLRHMLLKKKQPSPVPCQSKNVTYILKKRAHLRNDLLDQLHSLNPSFMGN